MSAALIPLSRSALPFSSHLLMAANSLGDTNCQHQFHRLLRLLTADSRHQSCLCYSTHSWFNGLMLVFFLLVFLFATEPVVSQFIQYLAGRRKRRTCLLGVVFFFFFLGRCCSTLHSSLHYGVHVRETSFNNGAQLFILPDVFMIRSLRASSWQCGNDGWISDISLDELLEP